MIDDMGSFSFSSISISMGIGIPSRATDIKPQTTCRPLDFLFHETRVTGTRNKKKEKKTQGNPIENMHGEFRNEISHKTDTSLEAKKILDTPAKHHVSCIMATRNGREKWENRCICI